MAKYLYVKADHNDGDYVTSLTEIDDKTLKKLEPLFNAIKNFKPYTRKSQSGFKLTHHQNFPTGENFRGDLGQMSAAELYTDIDQDVFQLFVDKYLPETDEFGIHTIKEISVLDVSKIKKYVNPK